MLTSSTRSCAPVTNLVLAVVNDAKRFQHRSGVDFVEYRLIPLRSDPPVTAPRVCMVVGTSNPCSSTGPIRFAGFHGTRNRQIEDFETPGLL